MYVSSVCVCSVHDKMMELPDKKETECFVDEEQKINWMYSSKLSKASEEHKFWAIKFFLLWPYSIRQNIYIL